MSEEEATHTIPLDNIPQQPQQAPREPTMIDLVRAEKTKAGKRKAFFDAMLDCCNKKDVQGAQALLREAKLCVAEGSFVKVELDRLRDQFRAVFE